MIPVYQKVISGTHGDCVPACIASILEIRIEDVAPFHLADDDCDWFDQMQSWLAGRGFNLIYPRILKGEIQVDYLHFLQGCHCILSVRSQRFDGATHAVVGKFVKQPNGVVKMQIVHDPNPENEPYPDDVEILGVEMIVKM